MRSSSCWTRSLREIGLLEACPFDSAEEMPPFLAEAEWEKEEKRNRRDSKVMAMISKANRLERKICRIRGQNQRAHEVWKEFKR